VRSLACEAGRAGRDTLATLKKGDFMSDNLYQEAIKIWLSKREDSRGKRRFWAEDIKEIKFGEGNYGVCETCDDPYVSIDFLVERNGKKVWHQMDIEDISPIQIVKECMDIYLTLVHRKEFIT
jgi:hypothetical protein